MWTSNFPSTTYRRDYPSPIACSCLLHQKSVGWKCVGLFLDSVSLVCVLFKCQCHAAGITIALQYILRSGKVMPPALSFFVQDCFSYLGKVGTSIIEESIMFPQENKNNTVIWPSNATARYILKGNEIITLKTPVLPFLSQPYSQHPGIGISLNVHR